MLMEGPKGFVIGIVLIGIMAILMYFTKALTLDGIVASIVMGLAILILSNLIGFLTLLLFLILGTLATFVGKSRKKSLEHLDAKDLFGRSAYNVMSNGIVAVIISSLYLLEVERRLVDIAYLASISAVLADTLGSEIGVLSDKVYLVTNFKRVPPGTNGGISVLGTIATFLGSFAIGLMALLYGFHSICVLLITFSGFAGAFIDSLLGATLEAKGLLDKGGVNILCSASAAGIAVMLFIILF